MGLCAILGAIVYLEIAYGPFNPSSASLTPPGGDIALAEPSLAAVSLPPLEDFSEIVDRPIFIPSRQPILAEDGTAAGSGATRNQFVLVGVVIAAEERMAVMQRRSAREVLRVVEGQQVDGWTVESITPEGVRLRHDDLVEEIILRETMGPAAREGNEPEDEDN
jgi:hypothetical protein